MRNIIQLSIVAVLLAGTATPVLAQANPAEPIAGVGEIVVTAQRRAESLQKVPLSVSVASADTLRERNFGDPSQLPLMVPSLQITDFLASPGATNFSIRGIGTSSFSHLIESTVATVIDDIVMSRPEMGVAEFSDLTRVEVLNGPQGMLFGKNASAGLVNIITNRPKLGKFEGFTNVSYENIEAVRNARLSKLDTTVNLPLSSIAAARFTGFYSRQDPLVGNRLLGGFDKFGREEYGGRAKLLIEPADGVSLYLSGDFAHNNGMGASVQTPRFEGPALAAIHAAAGVVPSPTNLYQANSAPTDLHYDIAGVQANLTYTFSNGATLSDIVGYRSYRSRHDIDQDMTQIDIVDFSTARFRFTQFTNELRLASPAAARLTYQAGVFYFHGFDRRQDDIRGNLGLGAPPVGKKAWLGLVDQDDLHPESYAAYAQGSYHATDKLTLTAGGRVTHDRVRFAGGYNTNDVAITFAGDGNGVLTYNAVQSHTNFSWRSSAQYAFTPDVNAYVTVARGYKGPGYNLSWAGTPGGQPIGPETSKAYEAGLKSTLFDKLLLNVSLYWENFTGFQVQSFLPGPIQGTGGFIIQNAGNLRARGVEANFALRAGPHLTISGNMAYNDAVYKKFVGAPCYAGQPIGPGECSSQGTFDASGTRLANAPRWTGTLSVDYRHPVSARWTALAHADVYSRSGVNFGNNNDPNTVQNGYTLLNASLALTSDDQKWTLRAFCRNCSNKRYVTTISSTIGGGPGDYSQSFALDAFRSIGVALNLRY